MSETDSNVKMIQKLEEIMKCRVISYVLADRLQGPQASIAMDALGLFHRHLETIGKVERIGLFIHSTGGDTMVPWPLVNLIREYCDKLIALVPHKAHSSATLICLGADEIVMTKIAQLSPVDPSVANAFNPKEEKEKGGRQIPISVEDVTAYFKLAKERADIDTPEARLGILEQLTREVHPLALGNVQRSHTMIRELSKKLLNLHMNPETDGGTEVTDKIVDILTEKLYSHQHLIPRREAKELIGLKVRYANVEEENAMMELLALYREELGIGSILNPVVMLGDRTDIPLDMKIAKIETETTEDGFIMKGRIQRSQQANQQPAVSIIEQSWKCVR